MSVLFEEKKPIEDLVNELMKYMQIEARYRNRLVNAAIQIRHKCTHLKHLSHLARTEVDESNPEHRKLLYDIWEGLDERTPPASFNITKTTCKDDAASSSWGDLGFQTPMTDFRMTGLLGLKSLHYVAVKHRKRSQYALKISQQRDAWFPFAITSINVTAWVLDDLRTNKLAAFLYHNDIAAEEVFFILHAYYLFAFVVYWEKHAVSSVFEFKGISVEFRKHILEEIEATILNVLHDNSSDRSCGYILSQSVSEKLFTLDEIS
ncbi:engulfment and cell motility 2, putative [Babesia caballi]|uniref:Engulfment and cell motility 2, putative n=1 Tax=Babesia caballi TaxID=5871 RepID=A0AAV4LPQ9_BABCB|nr:engulfment and cell motility 2, putative [Babesia caballi]